LKFHHLFAWKKRHKLAMLSVSFIKAYAIDWLSTRLRLG
jgi:hypothetical protein